MTSTGRWIAYACAALGLFLLAAPADAQNRRSRRRGDDDAEAEKGPQPGWATIVTERGAEIPDVQIREEKYEEIKYKPRRGKSTTIRGRDVREVRYTEGPAEFITGLGQLRAGRYDRAARSFAAARSGAEDGSWVKAHATFQLGEAYRLAGDDSALGKAEEEYETFLKENDGHFLTPAALYGLGLATAGQKKQSAAVEAFGKLEDGFSDRWRVKGKIGKGDAFLAQGNTTEARKAFEIAKGAATSFPELRSEAIVGIGMALVADKRYDDAVKSFDDIVRTVRDPAVAGSAWVGKGDCRFAQAEENGNDPNALKEALIAYQVCVTRYAGIPGSYAKALYMSSKIYDQLGLPALAQHMKDELTQSRPSSQWAKKLR